MSYTFPNDSNKNRRNISIFDSAAQTKNEEINGYIHGFTKTEQNRLIRQSKFFEPYIYSQINFSNSGHIIEVGCGVGAQINLLLNRWPHLRITGIDISAQQINYARQFLKHYLESDRVSLHIGDGRLLSFSENTFDGAFIFCVLEHTDKPVAILQELQRLIRPGSYLYCTEPFNRSLYIYPSCPAIEHYWQIFNQHQQELKGDPCIGVKLCNLVLQAGFSSPVLRNITIQVDQRTQDFIHRQNNWEWFHDCLLSAAPELLKRNKITEAILAEIQQEIQTIKYNLDSIFMLELRQVQAVKAIS